MTNRQTKTFSRREGCVATGVTRAEVERLIREGIRLHLEAMREAGQPIPEPTTGVELVEIA